MKRFRMTNWFQLLKTGIIKLNMKFPKLDLLTLLISLFLLSSCKDASTIGLDLDDNNKVTGTLLDDIAVTSRTVKDIPAATYSTGSGLSKYPLGDMNDAVFGSTTASLAMSVNLPSSTYYSFGTLRGEIDSAVLVLPFATSTLESQRFYGDTTEVFTVNVSQLSANLSTRTSWMSDAVYAAQPAVIGTFTGRVKPNTKFKVTSIVSGAADTAITVVPQLRIKLDPATVKTQIALLDSASRSTNARFNDKFKGLKITATRSSSSAKGGIMFLDLSTAGSNLEIYYKKQNATTSTLTDTVVAQFPVLTTTNPVAATVTHVYTTEINDQIANTGTQPATTYLQGMSGLRNLITFPDLKNLNTRLGSKLLISRAELVVDINNPADSVPFKIPLQLALYRQDIAQQRVNVPDNNPYSSTNQTGDIRTATSGVAFGGNYDATKTSYTFTVTNYVQDIIDGKIEDYGTYLAVSPLLASTLNLFPYPTTAGKAIIGSFNNTANRKIRLNIYYVKAQ